MPHPPLPSPPPPGGREQEQGRPPCQAHSRLHQRSGVPMGVGNAKLQATNAFIACEVSG